MKKIAVNGLGRIGRQVLNHYMNTLPKDIEIVAVNDIAPIDELVYLLKYDSVHGQPDFDVVSGDGYIMLGDKKMAVFAEKDPANLPWKDLDIDVVLECSGFFTKRAMAAKHLEAGAKKVIISAPSKDADQTIVLGVNENVYNPKTENVISNASCTTNSLAPPLKVLNDVFGIEHALVTTVHAYTSTQAILDKPREKRRRGRSAAVNIIPTTTGSAISTTMVIPELKDKMDAIALRVPVPDGAITDIVAHLKKDVTVEEINATLKKYAETKMKGILGYSDEELVSTDIINNEHSGIVDALSTRVVNKRMVKVLVWYDNEYGYSKRLLELGLFVAKQIK